MIVKTNYNIYLTEMLCVSKDGELAIFGGPNILAKTQIEAEKIAKVRYKNVKVVGKLV